MYLIFTMQAVVTAALFHAAVAQVPFKLVCPGAGFIERHDYTLECTVRGSDVTSASCIAPVSLIRLETVDAGVPKSIAHSPFPTCENNWSSVDNNNGRCADRDTNTDVYTYQFNVTADRAILTNLTGLRCFAECSGGPGVGNPFTFNTSKSCGPPVIFAAKPCLGYICLHGTQEKVAGCPCHCSFWWCGAKCGGLCWWVYLLICMLLVAVSVICYLCYRYRNVCESCLGGICVWTPIAASICGCCLSGATVPTNEEGKRRDSHEDTSEHLNGTNNAELRKIDGKTSGEQPAPEAPSDPPSNSGVASTNDGKVHKNDGKTSGEPPAPEAPSDPPSNSGVARSGKKKQKTPQTQGKKEQHSNK